MDTKTITGKEGRTHNSGLAKVAVQCSADTFVVNQSLVLRINICGKNRHLRQAAKRYVIPLKTAPHKMKVREEKLKSIIEWSQKNEDVRVLILTSSLVNPLAPVDEFSDLDIEFIFENNTNYISDKSWTLNFGNPIAMIEEDESCFNGKHAMKMVLYEDGIKADFKLYSKSNFIEETQQKKLPEDWDIGYKILIDKDGIAKQMLKPTYQISIIKKPSEKEFQNLINDFW